MAVKDILLLGDPKLYETSCAVKKNELATLIPKVELMRGSIIT